MGTNYYRIPKSKEMMERHQRLHDRVSRLDWHDASLIGQNFATIKNKDSEYDWDKLNPWEEFLNGTHIHLGKRSSGWKFLWNFNDNKYFSTKEELFKFIRSGRVVDEYGEIMDVEEFIQMALDWGKEDGWDLKSYYNENPDSRRVWANEDHEKYVDGLRVSTSIDFS